MPVAISSDIRNIQLLHLGSSKYMPTLVHRGASCRLHLSACKQSSTGQSDHAGLTDADVACVYITTLKCETMRLTLVAWL